jgi:serine/threonine protein kinase
MKPFDSRSARSSDYVNLLGKKYQLGVRIGGGSFGAIFHARTTRSGEDVAVKIESASSKSSQLRREAKIYLALSGEVGIPKVRWFGIGPDNSYMVMDLLGKSLEDLFNYCERKFTLKTVLVIAYELICRIETVHNKGRLVHRDIKPENFLMGRGRDRHTVYVIDFGLSKQYCNPRSLRHISQRGGYSLTGTARYASVNAHLGLELSRRDDLMSVGYVLVYFLKGILPWQGLHGSTSEEKYRLIFEKKQQTTLVSLCEGLPGTVYMRCATSKHLFLKKDNSFLCLCRRLFALLRGRVRAGLRRSA